MAWKHNPCVNIESKLLESRVNTERPSHMVLVLQWPQQETMERNTMAVVWWRWGEWTVPMTIWEGQWAGFNGILEMESMNNTVSCLGKAKRYQNEVRWVHYFWDGFYPRGHVWITLLPHFPPWLRAQRKPTNVFVSLCHRQHEREVGGREGKKERENVVSWVPGWHLSFQENYWRVRYDC